MAYQMKAEAKQATEYGEAPQQELEKMGLAKLCADFRRARDRAAQYAALTGGSMTLGRGVDEDIALTRLQRSMETYTEALNAYVSKYDD